ncbi:MAG: alanyl-tRNA editing protein, partial [Acidobacteriota bacterium]
MSDPIYCFERDPYKTRLKTEILETGESETGPFAILRDTIFYPEGGGQPCDLGTVGEGRIESVRRSGSEIQHYLDRPLPPGPVELHLDWQRRFDHMQQHTAQHLLSSLTLKHLGWETRSFHIGPELSDIEVGTPLPDRGRLDRVDELVAEVIRRALPVVDRRVDPKEYAELDVRSRGLPAGHAGDIRLVEIVGVDINT